MISKISQIDFNDVSCCFNKEYCFEFKGAVYEDLRNAEAVVKNIEASHDVVEEHSSFPCEFRIVFSVDDYDYVEDQALIDKLKDLRR